MSSTGEYLHSGCIHLPVFHEVMDPDSVLFERLSRKSFQLQSLLGIWSFLSLVLGLVLLKLLLTEQT